MGYGCAVELMSDETPSPAALAVLSRQLPNPNAKPQFLILVTQIANRSVEV